MRPSAWLVPLTVLALTACGSESVGGTDDESTAASGESSGAPVTSTSGDPATTDPTTGASATTTGSSQGATEGTTGGPTNPTTTATTATDFLPPGPQIDDCFPPDQFDKRTLVVFTMGGNDLAAIAKDGANGKPYDEVVADAEEALLLMREAVQWFVDDPNKFPNGVFVVFANIYEFTDGTGDLMSCPAAGLGGFDKPWEDVEALKQLVLWINEQVMDIAVSTQTDMLFLLENFCGHGFKAGDSTAPCYRGPNSETLFDVSCIHPTPAGHDLIRDLFTAVIDE